MSYTSTLGTRDSKPAEMALGWSRSLPCEATSQLALTQEAGVTHQWVTAFDVAITCSGLHPDNQGVDALVHALLQYAAQHSPRIDHGYVSPMCEVLHRLEASGINANALAFLKQYFNSADEAYRRRAT